MKKRFNRILIHQKFDNLIPYPQLDFKMECVTFGNLSSELHHLVVEQLSDEDKIPIALVYPQFLRQIKSYIFYINDQKNYVADLEIFKKCFNVTKLILRDYKKENADDGAAKSLLKHVAQISTKIQDIEMQTFDGPTKLMFRNVRVSAILCSFYSDLIQSQIGTVILEYRNKQWVNNETNFMMIISHSFEENELNFTGFENKIRELVISRNRNVKKIITILDELTKLQTIVIYMPFSYHLKILNAICRKDSVKRVIIQDVCDAIDLHLIFEMLITSHKNLQEIVVIRKNKSLFHIKGKQMAISSTLLGHCKSLSFDFKSVLIRFKIRFLFIESKHKLTKKLDEVVKLLRMYRLHDQMHIKYVGNIW